MQQKQYTGRLETKADDAAGSARTARAIITSEHMDRAGDIMRMAGADLEAFNRNPVVALQHTHTMSDLPVVGKSLSIRPAKQNGEKALEAEWEWAPTTLGTETADLWEFGALNATSIGFNPRAANPLDGDGERIEDDGKVNPWYLAQGREFTEWELLEFSVVVVPMNSQATRRAMETKEFRKFVPTVATGWMDTSLTIDDDSLTVDLWPGLGTTARELTDALSKARLAECPECRQVATYYPPAKAFLKHGDCTLQTAPEGFEPDGLTIQKALARLTSKDAQEGAAVREHLLARFSVGLSLEDAVAQLHTRARHVVVGLESQESKAGRVISSANLKLIDEAIDATGAAVNALKAVKAKAEPVDPGDGGETDSGKAQSEASAVSAPQSDADALDQALAVLTSDTVAGRFVRVAQDAAED